MHGEISIYGDDVTEVSISTDAKRNAKEKVREDGMRVISTGASFSLHEENNVMSLDYGHSGGWAEPAQFSVTVPHHTHLDIEVSAGGEIALPTSPGTWRSRTSTARSSSPTCPVERWSNR
jgi:hypothetical protein